MQHGCKCSSPWCSNEGMTIAHGCRDMLRYLLLGTQSFDTQTEKLFKAPKQLPNAISSHLFHTTPDSMLMLQTRKYGYFPSPFWTASASWSWTASVSSWSSSQPIGSEPRPRCRTRASSSCAYQLMNTIKNRCCKNRSHPEHSSSSTPLSLWSSCHHNLFLWGCGSLGLFWDVLAAVEAEVNGLVCWLLLQQLSSTELYVELLRVKLWVDRRVWLPKMNSEAMDFINWV